MLEFLEHQAFNVYFENPAERDCSRIFGVLRYVLVATEETSKNDTIALMKLPF